MSRVRVRVRKRAKGMSGKKLISAQMKTMSEKLYIEYYCVSQTLTLTLTLTLSRTFKVKVRVRVENELKG